MNDTNFSVTVTVAIPTRDRWNLASAALQSVLSQREVALEVIVVDDGSSVSAPAGPPFDDPRVRMVRRATSGGVSSARNVALSLARGRWIAFLDDDDLWHPAHLSTLLARATDSAAGFVYSAQIQLDARLAPVHMRPAPLPDNLEVQLLAKNVIGTPSCLLADTGLVREAGSFDSSFAMLADWDLWLRLAARAPAAASFEHTTGYREHDANMHLDISRSREEYRRLKQRYRYRTDALGIGFSDVDFSMWLAVTCRRSGRRLQAARWFVDSAWRGRRPRRILRAIGALVAPDAHRPRLLRASGTGHSSALDAASMTSAGWTITPVQGLAERLS